MRSKNKTHNAGQSLKIASVKGCGKQKGLQSWFKKGESSRRPAFFREFVPDMWHMITEHCFTMFSFDTRGWKQTCTWWPQRSGRFIKKQQIRYVFGAESIQCIINRKQCILWLTCSQCKDLRTGMMSSMFLVLAWTRAAFWVHDYAKVSGLVCSFT